MSITDKFAGADNPEILNNPLDGFG
jgi:hypothetical protein